MDTADLHPDDSALMTIGRAATLVSNAALLARDLTVAACRCYRHGGQRHEAVAPLFLLTKACTSP